jgi:chromate transporter
MLLWKIFVLFSRVALFSWGGGPASLALMQREATTALWIPPGSAEPVTWVSPDEFADAVAMSNALPGPIAPQVSAYIGYKLAGLPGAVAAVVGTVVPATVLMLILVVYFFGIKDSPVLQSMFKAIRPVVVGLLLWTAYDMGATVFGFKKLGWSTAVMENWDKGLIALVAFALCTFTRISPVLIIIGAGMLGLLIYR